MINKICYAKIAQPSDKFEFDYWFTGFFEGAPATSRTSDGSFSMNYNDNRCFLVINQKDPRILVYIRKNLKIGNIIKYDGIYRWAISAKRDMFNVIQILNGRLLLKKTNKRLEEWITLYNKYYKLNPEDNFYIHYKGPGEWREKNSWLSGFIDAAPATSRTSEGCFNIRIVNLKEQKLNVLKAIKDLEYENHQKLIKIDPKLWKKKIKTEKLMKSISFRVRLRFLISQKKEEEIMHNLKSFLTGSISVDKNREIYTFVLDANTRQLKLINYIFKHPLRSSKHQDFLKFVNMYNRLKLKKHLNIENIAIVINFLSKS